MPNRLGCNQYMHKCSGAHAHQDRAHRDPFAATIAQAQADHDELVAWAHRYARTPWEGKVLVYGTQAMAHRDGLSPDAIRHILGAPRPVNLSTPPEPDADLGVPTVESIGTDGTLTLHWLGWGDPARREAYRGALSAWLGDFLSWLDGVITGVH